MNHFLPHRAHGELPLRSAAPSAALALAGELPVRRVRVLGDDGPATLRWCEALASEGLHVDCEAARCDEAPLAIVLHVTRRLHDHLGLLRELRERDIGVPLVVACQQLRDLDHVLALEMGADDVLDAATVPAVVAARLRALARRRIAGPDRGIGPDHLSFGALDLHLRERRVRLHGADIAFTEGEFEVLWLLASQAGQPVSRAELLRRLRGLPYQRMDRSIDCRIYRIRAKLGDSDGPAQRIRTVRNCGYLFSPAAW